MTDSKLDLSRAVAMIEEWTHQHGAALCPKGADTYGEGMRDAKRQVAGILSRIRAEATAEPLPEGFHRRVANQLRAQQSPDDFRTMLREMAQSWRDEAFGGQHCSELRSNILEECADELTAALDEPTTRAQLTSEERAVLAAVADADIETVGGRHRQRRQFMFELQEDAVCRAELARRAARKDSKP